MLKTTVILTKIWFFFLSKLFCVSKNHFTTLLQSSIVLVLFFLFQINVVKRNKKDNYSVCLNVAIFKSEQRKPLFLLFDLKRTRIHREVRYRVDSNAIGIAVGRQMALFSIGRSLLKTMPFAGWQQSLWFFQVLDFFKRVFFSTKYCIFPIFKLLFE